MNDNDWTIVIPSRNRADKVITLDYLRGLDCRKIVFVDDENEKAEYEKHVDCEVIATGTTGIQMVRNAILDYFPIGEKIIFMCDDVEAVKKKAGKKLVPLCATELRWLIKKGFSLCQEAGIHLWGVSAVANAFYMREGISSNKFIIGTFSGVIVSEIRHDKQLRVKEDYDFTLKHIIADGKVLRFDNYCVAAKHYTNAGGAVDYRSDEVEQAAIKRLFELYPGMIRKNPKRKNEILITLRKKRSNQ